MRTWLSVLLFVLSVAEAQAQIGAFGAASAPSPEYILLGRGLGTCAESAPSPVYNRDARRGQESGGRAASPDIDSRSGKPCPPK
jgi:hypothetical protein